MTRLSIIYAKTIDGYFSKKEGGLPWPRISEDINYFKNITTGNGKNAIIMGRKTFESLKEKPLPNRYNIIVSNSLYNKRWKISQNNHMQGLDFTYDIKCCLEEAINTAKEKKFEEVFVIGGIQLIYETLRRSDIDNIYINIIDGNIINQIDKDNCNKIKDIIPDYMTLESSCLDSVITYFPTGTRNEVASELVPSDNTFLTKNYSIKYLCYSSQKDLNIDSNKKLLNQTGFRVPTLVAGNPVLGAGNLKQEVTSSILSDLDYTYESWGEEKYRDLVKKILETGKSRDDRTGVGTLSLFSEYLSFDVSKYFPLLTLKKVFWKGVVEELLFFISGSSDTKILENKGVNIWKANTSREFLDKRDLTNYREGEYGPSYGYNWRHFGKKYIPLNDVQKETNTGIDQLQEAIDLIKSDPHSRRILVSAWNPLELKNVPLPPCHYSFEFYVDNDELSLLVNMRSCDVFLGLPFNIASYGLLLYIVSSLTDKKPKHLNFMLGDTHIYKNHISQAEKLLNRNIKKAPTLSIPGLGSELPKNSSIDEFRFDDIQLNDYNSHPSIKADMAI